MSVQVQEIERINEPSKSVEFCRYLGLIALFSDKETSYEHLEQQIVTELAESLDAEMGTHGKPIPLTVEHGELFDIDGRPMVRSAREWSAQQKNRALADPRLQWFARIAEIEANECSELVAFAEQAGVGDVRIKISPFPEEAADDQATRSLVASEGFRVDSRRAFIRTYEKTNDGISEHIQSIDASSLGVWNETLANVFGLDAVNKSEQILIRNIDIVGARSQELTERIAMTYDKILFERTGLAHRYGRNPFGSTEANTFVRGHMAVVHDTIAQLCELDGRDVATDLAASRILYNSKALIEKLLNGGSISEDIRSESAQAGSEAALEGRQYFGCSGANSAVALNISKSREVAGEITIPLKNGMIGVYVSKCPMPGCGKECFVAVRNKEGKYSCQSKKCAGYDEKMIDAAYGIGSSGSRVSFTDALAEVLIDLFSSNKKPARS